MPYKRFIQLLDAVALTFTIFLFLYGFMKGYDLAELIVNNLYFMTIITTQILHFLELTE